MGSNLGPRALRIAVKDAVGNERILRTLRHVLLAAEAPPEMTHALAASA
jgi:hypothetical protein